jgi:uncharacterized protein (DUF58 family)
VSSASLSVGEAFPLVPRHRLSGLELGPFRSTRRGTGSDPAGSRPYEPGDDVRLIDWAASARLSAAHQTDEFIVTERFAEQAPRVVVLSDRRLGMALYPAPWLSKPAVVDTCERLISESGFRVRGLVGALHFVGSEPRWSPPTGNPRTWRGRERDTSYTAEPGLLGDGIERIAHARAMTAGSFLFVLSDFLDPVPEEAWRLAVARDWDVVPVVIRDPTWETSFPAEVGGLVLPLEDPLTGDHTLVRLGKTEALQRREWHETRLGVLLADFAELGLDPIVLASDDPETVFDAFLDWAARRLAPVGRAW